MRKKSKALLLILFSVLLVDTGQLLLKAGLNNLGSLDFSLGIVSIFFSIFTNPFVFFGVLFFVASSFFWLLALSKAHLSYAFPILSLGYVIVFVLSWVLFGEQISLLRTFGLVTIVGGVLMLART